MNMSGILSFFLPPPKPPDTYGNFGALMAPHSRLGVIILGVVVVWLHLKMDKIFEYYSAARTTNLGSQLMHKLPVELMRLEPWPSWQRYLSIFTVMVCPCCDISVWTLHDVQLIRTNTYMFSSDSRALMVQSSSSETFQWKIAWSFCYECSLFDNISMWFICERSVAVNWHTFFQGHVEFSGNIYLQIMVPCSSLEMKFLLCTAGESPTSSSQVSQWIVARYFSVSAVLEDTACSDFGEVNTSMDLLLFCGVELLVYNSKISQWIIAWFLKLGHSAGAFTLRSMALAKGKFTSRGKLYWSLGIFLGLRHCRGLEQ